MKNGGERNLPYTYNKLRGRIIEKFGSQEKFAEKIGISKNSLSLKMTGKTGISQLDIERWSELLDIDKTEFSDYYFT